MIDRFEDQRKKDQQSFYREREVQNLKDLIYGAIDSEKEELNDDESFIVDTNRYDVHFSKLEIYLIPDVKRLLKSKFVTGQSQDQIMKNLLNMSDSDEEEDKKLTKKMKRAAKQEKEEGDEEESDGNEAEDKNKKPYKGKGGAGEEDLRKQR